MPTFEELKRELIRRRPNLDPVLAGDLINQAISAFVAARPRWNALFRRLTLTVPPRLTGGTVSVSRLFVTGHGTDWPTADLVNATCPQAVPRPGVYRLRLSSLREVKRGDVLVADADGDPELVQVLQARDGVVELKFSRPHNENFTLTLSSLANRQIVIGGDMATIGGVVAPDKILLAEEWTAGPVQDAQYSIEYRKIVLDQDVMDVVQVYDAATQQPLVVARSHGELDAITLDVRRTQSGPPSHWATCDPHPITGAPRFEVWPHPGNGAKLIVLYYRRMQRLIRPDDELPAFIDPQAIITGATAIAIGTRIPDSAGSDPYYDPEGARLYAELFRQAIEHAIEADEALDQLMYGTSPRFAAYPGDTEYGQRFPWEAYYFLKRW